MKHCLQRLGMLALLCLLCHTPCAYAQSPAETKAFVRTVANGPLKQQRKVSKEKHPSHAALIAEAERINGSGSPNEKAQFAFVLALFDVDYIDNRDRLLQMSRSVNAVEIIPSYLVRLYDQKHDISLLEALLAMRADGDVAEELADEETRLFSQRPALALRLISSDTKRFNQAAETVAVNLWTEREGLSQAEFAKRKPLPQLDKASRLATPSSRQTYHRFVAAAYARYAPMGKPTTTKNRTKAVK